VQNLAQFRTTLEFDCEYLPNDRDVHNRKDMIDIVSSRVQWEKSGEHQQQSWTCEFGPTQINFFGRPYFGP